MPAAPSNPKTNGAGTVTPSAPPAPLIPVAAPLISARPTPAVIAKAAAAGGAGLKLTKLSPRQLALEKIMKAITDTIDFSDKLGTVDKARKLYDTLREDFSRDDRDSQHHTTSSAIEEFHNYGLLHYSHYNTAPITALCFEYLRNFVSASSSLATTIAFALTTEAAAGDARLKLTKLSPRQLALKEIMKAITDKIDFSYKGGIVDEVRKLYDTLCKDFSRDDRDSQHHATLSAIEEFDNYTLRYAYSGIGISFFDIRHIMSLCSKYRRNFALASNPTAAAGTGAPPSNLPGLPAPPPSRAVVPLATAALAVAETLQPVPAQAAVPAMSSVPAL